MTLHDLTEQLSPAFPTSVQKDLKTAVRILARALTSDVPQSCALETCLQPLPQLLHTVKQYLSSQGKGAYTIRNVKNNLSRLFRLAEAHGLFVPVPVTLTRRFTAKQRPRRLTLTPRTWNDGSHLRRRDWPAEAAAEYEKFTQWATDPLVHNREAAWKKRATTLERYEAVFGTYFGYLHHVRQIRPVQFSHLFDYSLIEAFTHWHINEKWHRPTHAPSDLVKCLHAITRQYRPDPVFLEQLKRLRKLLPKLHPIYDKTDAWLPLAELERVGIALWPSKSPDSLLTSTINAATRASLSLMLRLWVYIPYRQRNMREMELDRNLYRTTEGQWRIRYIGEELKVSSKRGKTNTFDLPFPPNLIPILEAYLSIWRPLLTCKQNAKEVFLNRCGNAYTMHGLRRTLKGHVYRFTGRAHWHPHIVRTVWATEWIKSSGDFMTAAIMLNDRLETVIANYSHLRDENVAENAYEWVQNRINGH